MIGQKSVRALDDADSPTAVACLRLDKSFDPE